MKFLILLAGFTFCMSASAKEGLSQEANDVLAETQGASAVMAVAAATTKKSIVVEDLQVVPVMSTDVAAGDAGVVNATGLTATAASGEGKTEAEVPLKEDEIPLHLEKKVAAAGTESPVMRVIFAMMILGVMGGGAFYLFRRHGRPGPKKNAPQIKILTQHYLGPKKSIAIIRVAGESILIGVTDHNISMIKSLALLDEEIPQETPENFGNVMNDVALRGKTIEDDGEDFQMSGLNQIKDVVSKRLKNMRSFE